MLPVVSMAVEQLSREGESKSYGFLLIAGFFTYSNGGHYNHLYSKMLFVCIPILQKTQEGKCLIAQDG